LADGGYFEKATTLPCHSLPAVAAHSRPEENENDFGGVSAADHIVGAELRGGKLTPAAYAGCSL